MGFLLKANLIFVGVLAVIAFAPGIPPYLPFEAYTVEPPLPFEGPLSRNAILDKAEEFKLDREIVAPDSLSIRGDDIFTGVMGGDLVRISKDGKVKTVARFSDKDKCEGDWDYQNCGRIVGTRFSPPDGKLIVCDIVNGLYRVDVDTGKYEVLASPKEEIEGLRPLFFDDVDVAKDGTIYWADGSAIGDASNFILEMLSGPSGRLIKTDPKTKKHTVLMSNLHFAGGVQLSKNEDFVLVCDSMRGRVWRYYLKGQKKGQKEIFTDRLPGAPDNIRSNGKDGFYFPIGFPRVDVDVSIADDFGPRPLVRRFIARIRFFIVSFLQIIETLVPSRQMRQWIAYAQHLGPMGDLNKMPLTAIIVETDGEGNIVRSFQKNAGPVNGATEFAYGKDYHYIGSLAQRKFYRIKTEYLNQ